MERAEKRSITVEVNVIHCDMCDTHKIDYEYAKHFPEEACDLWIAQCVVCGKDTCELHEGYEACEDGYLCPECHKELEFELEDGGVGVVNKKTGAEVNAPYL